MISVHLAYGERSVFTLNEKVDRRDETGDAFCMVASREALWLDASKCSGSIIEFAPPSARALAADLIAWADSVDEQETT